MTETCRATTRQPVQMNGEKPDQNKRQPKIRHGCTGKNENTNTTIKPMIFINRTQHAHWNTNTN